MKTPHTLWQVKRLKIKGIDATKVSHTAIGGDFSILFSGWTLNLQDDDPRVELGKALSLTAVAQVGKGAELFGFSVAIRGQAILTRGARIHLVAQVGEERRSLEFPYGDVTGDIAEPREVLLSFVTPMAAFIQGRRPPARNVLKIWLAAYAARLDKSHAAQVAIDSVDIDALTFS